MFIRDEDNSTTGHWTIADCKPDQAESCGGAAHKILQSPKVNSNDLCPHQLPTEGWVWCDGEMGTSGYCSHYANDDTIKLSCQN